LFKLEEKTSTSKKETFYLLLTKILLEPEEQPGEPSVLLNKKKKLKNPHIYPFSKITKKTLKLNSKNSAMIF